MDGNGPVISSSDVKSDLSRYCTIITVNITKYILQNRIKQK